MATSADEGTEPEWMPEELALERQLWTSFRLELAKMEEKRMTWKDRQRAMARLKKAAPDVHDAVEAIHAIEAGDAPDDGNGKIIPITVRDIESMADKAEEILAMERVITEEEESIIAEALADYNGGDK